MALATLVFSSREWLIPAGLLFSIGLAALFFSYRRSSLSRKHRVTAVLLKTVGFSALALCLLEPLWTGQRARPGANYFVVLADNSQGMQVRDRGEKRTRSEQLQELVANPQSSWESELDQNFQLRRYYFDSRLQQTKDFSDLTFDGRSSSLGLALRTLGDRYRGRPLAGILLFSDGNATDLGTGLPDVTGLPPIYPIVMGKGQPSKDLALQTVTVSQTAFEDAPVSIQATANGSGLANARITAELLDDKGKQIEVHAETWRKESDPLAFRFQFRPEQTGVSFYRVKLSAEGEGSAAAAPDAGADSEATLANNSRMIVVDRGRGPHRILYVTGRPNWEYKFLNRALADDPEVQLVALIRIAKREPKFEFRGRTGESSNPLFRGFDRKDEETERYDQPVLVRLNTRDEMELRGGFPKTPEELFEFKAIILDDIESAFFTRDQMALIQKFVSERGGGFLMLGGQECFQEGQFGRTPIADVLPVYIDRGMAETAPVSPGKWQLQLTREGWLQPWIRLRNNEIDERTRLDSVPPFMVVNQVRDIKPGASLLATVTDSSAVQVPALVAHRYGAGRAAAMTIGDLWRWGLQNEAQQRDMAKAWRQLARWLIADTPQNLDLQVEQTHDANQSVLLQLRVRDKKFQPIENAAVVFQVDAAVDTSTADSKAVATENGPTAFVRVQAEPSATEPGLYEAQFVPRLTGAYRAEAIVADTTGIEIGRAEAGWTADPAADEFKSLQPNRDLLAALAKATKGEVISTDNLEAFARSLLDRPAPVSEAWAFPLWHTPVLFAFALLCFIAEWAIRRWKGLA